MRADGPPLRFVSESTVYRILKSRGLVTTPAYRLMEAADQFYNPTTAPNQLWQTDFTYFKIKHWGWYYLSTVLDDYSRYILAWEICPGMQATDVERTVQAALQASSLTTGQRPRILSDNGSAYISRYLKEYWKGESIEHIRSAASAVRSLSSHDSTGPPERARLSAIIGQ